MQSKCLCRLQPRVDVRPLGMWGCEVWVLGGQVAPADNVCWPPF